MTIDEIIQLDKLIIKLGMGWVWTIWDLLWTIWDCVWVIWDGYGQYWIGHGQSGIGYRQNWTLNGQYGIEYG